MERRLAAILVADAVGYSRLMGLDEIGTHTQFKTHLNELLSPQISAHKGRIVKTTGDGLLAEFSSAVDAVQCAVSMQEAVTEHNADISDDRRMSYRMGINLGEVIVEKDDIYGDGVNIAARLETLAEPGGICLSGDTYRQVRKRVAFDFEDLGEQQVKNIDEPIHVYRLITVGSGDDRAAEVQMLSSDLAEKPSIVILPFENLNRDPEQEYFCDGLTQDLTTDLSRFANLFVIAANSAFTFKGRPTKAQDVRRELGVRYMLEGSIQRSGTRVRINAQLIDATTGHHLWADRFDRSAEDLFSLQDEIIQRIVSVLAIKVEDAERARAFRKPTSSMNAYDAFLRGAYLIAQHTRGGRIERDPADMEGSRGYFRRAIELDPDYARAWGWLAYTIVSDWLDDRLGEEALVEAERHARKAVALNPSDYDTHWALGYVLLHARRFDEALNAYRRAVQLNGNDPHLLVDMAEMLLSIGEHDAAIEKIKRAMTFNPQVPDWYRWDLAWALYLTGNYEAAITELHHVVEPGTDMRLLAAACYAQSDRPAEAERALRAFLAERPDWTAKAEMRTAIFKRQPDADHWLDGILKAGLPPE